MHENCVRTLNEPLPPLLSLSTSASAVHHNQNIKVDLTPFVLSLYLEPKGNGTVFATHGTLPPPKIQNMQLMFRTELPVVGYLG